MTTIVCRIEKKVYGMFWHRLFTRFKYSKNMWYYDYTKKIFTNYTLLNFVEIKENDVW